MEAYTAAAQQANDDLVRALESRYEFIKKSKSPRSWAAQLAYIKDDIRAIKDDGALPEGWTSQIKSENQKYMKTITKARDTCLKEYEQAASAYGKLDRIGRAEAVRDECRAFRQRTEALLAQPIRRGWVLSTGEMPVPSQWLYTTTDPGAGWASPQFDAKRWSTGPGAFGWSPDMEVFGKMQSPKLKIGTKWISGGIWLRTSVKLPRLTSMDVLVLKVWIDDIAEIYVNGDILLKRGWKGGAHELIPLDRGQQALFRKGTNSVAVHGLNTAAPGQFIDVGLGLNLNE